ncbi:hypothetical protein FIBSPDRAFT_947404 [Athelia psychrophila]|uniref:Rab-GAP TBC domain-containing protein n=1 Tax=Athelia psychrophila TaxID=1759441 RepID=A0A166RRH6_9AGAM|nr:hypothetical protein FIBSPDRAFT_947404 [Fibularhizoctonia sp. CBS 109695]
MSASIVKEHAEEAAVDDAALLDWDALRKASLLPGGFGEGRAGIWPRLLNATPSASAASAEEPSNDAPSAESDAPVPEPHHDERQIHLDTERSFVFYPVGTMQRRHELQAELDDLLVTLFRQHRQLSYFQGYHDIITVLFLTLPPALRLPCAEKLSLHRVRDSMGSTLEPVLGLLRVLKSLLRIADPSFAALLERNTPLPYYALSNLLTLFSHDVPTLPLIQHVFDYLLSRPPICVVYLGAAILLARKQEVERLEEEGEEGMVHSLLSGLPELLDGDEEQAGTSATPDAEVEAAAEDIPLESEDMSQDTSASTTLQAEPVGSEPASVFGETAEGEPLESEDISQDISASTTLQVEPVVSEPASVFGETADAAPIVEPEATASVATTDTIDSDATLTDSQTSLHPPSTPPSDDEQVEQEPEYEPSPPSSRSASPEPTVVRPKIQLSTLLEHADALYMNFPPADPSLGLATIMGPNSVVFTWSEDPSKLPADDDAEGMAVNAELIVHPHIDFPSDEEEAANDEKERRRRKKGPGGGKRRAPRFERRAMIAGAVLVLGLSIIVYGMQARHTRGHAGRAWQKLGGTVVGVADELAEVFKLWY